MYNNRLGFEAQALETRYKSGARWFLWIAGLSVITSIISLTGSNVAFILSLGTTRVIDAFATGAATELGNAARIVGLVFDILVAGVFVLIGWLALKRHLWSFIAGMILFAADALILLAFQIWISFAFHVLVMFWIFKGYQAGRKLVALELEMQAAPPPPPPDFAQPVAPTDGGQS